MDGTRAMKKRFGKVWLAKRMQALDREWSRLEAEIERTADLLRVMGTSHPREKGDLSEEEREDTEVVECLEALQSTLGEVEEAQERLHRGTYGDCLICLGPIPRRRLEVLPSAICCGVCQTNREELGAATRAR